MFRSIQCRIIPFLAGLLATSALVSAFCRDGQVAVHGDGSPVLVAHVVGADGGGGASTNPVFYVEGSCQLATYGLEAGGTNIGTLTSDSSPTLGSTLSLDIFGFTGSTTGFFLVSPIQLPAGSPVLGGTLYVGAADAVVLTVPLTGGAGTLNVTLTGNPSAVGVTAYWQALGVDLAVPGGLVFSNGLAMTVCELVNPSGNMAPVPAGTYAMGDHQGIGESDELPLHSVSLDPLYMDVYEVTNEQYRDYLNSAHEQGLIDLSGGIVYGAGSSEPYCDTDSSDPDSRIVWNASSFEVESGCLGHPMVDVSWYGAVAFANWRSAQDGLSPCYDLDTWSCDFTVNGYRLPTEAEWEYAARGGEHDPFYVYPWGDSIDGGNANYSNSSDPFEIGPFPWTTPVGYYAGNQVPAGADMANGYGLHDIAGNVWEWCNDWYSSTYYDESPKTNPHGPSSGSYRVLRGGSFFFGVTYLRSASRNGHSPPFRNHGIGFRLVRL